MNWLGWIVIWCEAGFWEVCPPPSPPPSPPSPPPVHQTHRGPSHCSQPASHYNLSLANSVQIENCTVPNLPFVSYWSLTHSRALWHIVGKSMAWSHNTLQPSGTLHTIGYLSVPKEKASNEREKSFFLFPVMLRRVPWLVAVSICTVFCFLSRVMRDNI